MNWWQKEQLIYHKNLGLLVNLCLLLCTLWEEKMKRRNVFASIVSNLTLQLKVAVQIYYLFRIVIPLLLKQSFFGCKQENRHVFRDKCEKKPLRITWEKNREGQGPDRREREWRETEGRGKRLVKKEINL
jgi:hypothetical protein